MRRGLFDDSGDKNKVYLMVHVWAAFSDKYKVVILCWVLKAANPIIYLDLYIFSLSPYEQEILRPA